MRYCFILFLIYLINICLCSLFPTLKENAIETSSFILCITFLISIVFVKGKKNKLIVYAGFMLRIAFMIVDLYIPSLARFNIQSGYDEVIYQNVAVRLSENLRYGVVDAYSELLGTVYHFLGTNEIIGETFNIVLSMTAIIIFYNILIIIEISPENLTRAFAIFCIAPNYAMMSPLILREGIIITLITLSLYDFVKWWKYGLYRNIIRAFLIPCIAAFFHSGAIAVAAGYAIIYIFYDRKRDVFILDAISFFKASIILVAFIILTFGSGDYLFRKFENINDIESLSNHVNIFSQGGSAYLSGQNNESIPKILLNTPIRMIYFIFAPVPWLWRGFNDIIAFLFCTMIYMIALYNSEKIFRYSYRNEKCNLVKALTVVGLICALMFAWGVSNSGTALRHREKFLAIFVLILYLSKDILNEQKRNFVCKK